jgi:hypothetical protein
MKPLLVIAALVVACAAALLAVLSGHATEYATNPNPACRLMPQHCDRRAVPAGAEPRRRARVDAARGRRKVAAQQPVGEPQTFRRSISVDAEGSMRKARHRFRNCRPTRRASMA